MRNRQVVKRTLLVLLAIVASVGILQGQDCIALLSAQVVEQLGRNSDDVFRIAAGGSKASEGLAAVLRSREDFNDAGIRVRDILYFFSDSADEVFEQISIVKGVDGLGDLAIELGKSQSAAQGAAAGLRWATTRMNPSDIARFEFSVPPKRVDILDSAGNLLEFKSLNFANYNDFILKREFEEIFDQATVFHNYVKANGKQLSLAFENPVPANFVELFNTTLGSLVKLSPDGTSVVYTAPNVVFVNGF